MPAPKKQTPKSLPKTKKKVLTVESVIPEVPENIQAEPAEVAVPVENYGPNGNDSSKNVLVLFGVIILTLVLALFLFSQKQGKIADDGTGASNNSITATNSGECGLPNATIDSSKSVKSGSKIKVDYIGRLEDGTIFDSSIEACAKKTKTYSAGAGRTYEPLSFTVGQGQMIKGFDAGVVGMKLGESKKITVAPKDGYGEAKTNQTIDSKYLNDSFDQEVPAESFKDTITKTFPKEVFGDKTYKVGETIESSGISGKVISLTATGLTISITNTQNPFFGKKLIVGLKASYQGNDVTIKKIGAEMITVTILNKQSPFFGKKIEPGLVGKLPNGQEVKIISINGEKAEVEVPSTHELAGKTLIFEVQVKQID